MHPVSLPVKLSPRPIPCKYFLIQHQKTLIQHPKRLIEQEKRLIEYTSIMHNMLMVSMLRK